MLEMLLVAGSHDAPVIAGGYGLFHSGNRNGSMYPAIDQYGFSTDTYLSAINLILALRRTGHIGVGNADKAVFGSGLVNTGGSTLATDTYTHATGTLGTGTNLTVARVEGCGFGNSIKGMFASGLVSSSPVKTTESYAYASNAVAVGGVLVNVGRNLLTGAGNTATGYAVGGLNGGTPQTAVDKYTYADNTTVAGTALAQQFYRASATATPSFAYIGGGVEGSATAKMRLLNFSNDAVTAGTNLSVVQQEFAAAGNGTVGFYAGGRVAITNTTIYTYAGNLSVAGAALPTGRHSFCAASSQPGSF